MVRSARRARLEPWGLIFETAAFVGLLRMRELVYGRRMRIFPIALLPALLAPAIAHAQTDDLLGKYASAKIYCIDDEKLVFEIARGVINGPNFHCIMGNARPAGTGLEDYDSKCTLGDKISLGVLSLDLTDKADHVRVKLPEKTDWITIYPCK